MLLQQLRQFMVENFGFGDFVFRLPDGTEVGRAHDLKTLEEMLERSPPRASPTTASGTTSRTGSRRAPSSPWPTHSGRARSPTSAAWRTCGAAHRGDPGIPHGAGPAHRGRLRPRDVRRLRGSRASAAARSAARRAAWRSSTCSWTTTGSAAVSGTWTSPFRRRRPRHGRLRPVPRRERPSRLRDRDRRRRGDPPPLPRGRVSRGDGAGPGAFLEVAAVPARRALLEPARGLAVPALRRRLRDVHAAEQPRQPRHPPRPAPGGDQAGLRLHVLAPAKATSTPRPTGSRRRRWPSSSRRSSEPRTATLLPGDFGGGPVAQLLSRRRRCRPEDGIAAVALGFGESVVDGEPASGSARDTPATSCSSRRSGTSARTRSGSSSPWTFRRPGTARAPRVRARAPRPRDRRRGRDAGCGRLDLLPGERRHLRRHLPPGRPARHVRPDPQARDVPAGRDPGHSASARDARHGRAGRDRVRRRSSGPGSARRSSASCSCARWPSRGSSTSCRSAR